MLARLNTAALAALQASCIQIGTIAALDKLRDDGMVARDLLQRLAADEIGAAVADVDDLRAVTDDHGGDERGAHAGVCGLLAGAAENRLVCGNAGVPHPAGREHRVLFTAGEQPSKPLQIGPGGQRGGQRAAVGAAHAVAHQKDGRPRRTKRDGFGVVLIFFPDGTLVRDGERSQGDTSL